MELVPYRQNNADIAVLRSLLHALPVDEIITYEKLSQAVGYEIRKRRHILDRTLALLVDEGKVYDCIVNIGLKRLSDSDIIRSAPADMRKIRRRAMRSAKRLMNVGWDGLTREEQQQHNLYISALGALAYVASDQNINRLTVACSNSTLGGLPAAETLKLLVS